MKRVLGPDANGYQAGANVLVFSSGKSKIMAMKETIREKTCGLVMQAVIYMRRHSQASVNLCKHIQIGNAISSVDCNLTDKNKNKTNEAFHSETININKDLEV